MRDRNAMTGKGEEMRERRCLYTYLRIFGDRPRRPQSLTRCVAAWAVRHVAAAAADCHLNASQDATHSLRLSFCAQSL